MSCKELVLVVLAVSGCRDRCESRRAPPAPAQKPVESVEVAPPNTTVEEPVVEESPPPRAEPAPRPRPQVAEAQPEPYVEPVPRYEEPLPAQPPQLPPPPVRAPQPPAPVQLYPQALPQYNDAGVLVPVVPLFIDPSAAPGTPGNGAPDPKRPNG
jgi:hypothetical protein